MGLPIRRFYRQLIASIALFHSGGIAENGYYVEAVHVHDALPPLTSTLTFVSIVLPHQQRSSQKQKQPVHVHTSSSSSSSSSSEEQIRAHHHHHHPSQPQPDVQSARKLPIFPGAIPIDTSIDIPTCVHQTSQTNPSNALLGKPAQGRCRHGFTQAFSLDPMPPNKLFGTSKKVDRINSGLLKLTCPLLVSSVDLLEDDGFMNVINSKLLLAEDEDEEEEDGDGDGDGDNNEWMKCMIDAHNVHAETRKELIFGRGNNNNNNLEDDKIDESDNNFQFQLLRSKLGERGAQSFLDAGVAGATKDAKNADVKCLHAWLADYLMRTTTGGGGGGGSSSANNDDSSSSSSTEQQQQQHHHHHHPIGEAIVKALSERGVPLSGTDTCHEVCSGCCSRSSKSSEEFLSVQVPTPRNRQRKKRREI